MTNKQKTLIFAFLLIAIVASFYLIFSLPEPHGKITGADITRLGKTVVNFRGPSQPSGGGSAGAQAECCTTVWWNDREFWCDCVVNERGLIRIQPYTCCRNPLALECFDFCNPAVQAPEGPAGVCPIERTCGAKCCNQGEQCENGQCFVPQQEYQLPPPPQVEGPTLVAIPYTTYSFPWWYFILATIILLVLAYILYRKTRAQKPSETIQKPIKRRKK